MTVEHITQDGRVTKKDTSALDSHTIKLLKDSRIRKGSITLPFPNFLIKIASTTDGAIFSFIKNGKTGITNVCCFDELNKMKMFDSVRMLQRNKDFAILLVPELPQWIYNIVVDPLALSADDILVAAKLELYLYYSLYLARYPKKSVQ